MTICICEFCQRAFHAARMDARFCSDRCKQKAYRRRKDWEIGSIHREKQRQTNIAITKQTTTKMVVCEFCGQHFFTTILHTNKTYCNDACKQKAYRQRTKLKVSNES